MKLFVSIFTLKKIPTLSWSSFNTLNLKPKSITLLYLIFGLILCELGETILIAASAGVSPWTVLAQGLSVKTSHSIGLTTFIVSSKCTVFMDTFKTKARYWNNTKYYYHPRSDRCVPTLPSHA